MQAKRTKQMKKYALGFFKIDLITHYCTGRLKFIEFPQGRKTKEIIHQYISAHVRAASIM